MNRRVFYVTTPIYYVNDQPHIGHTYTTVVADALARFHRLCGEDVYFLTGTDEHGQKIERAARARGITPQQLADEVVANYRRLWPQLSISNDDLIRTTEIRHKRGVTALFARIRERSPEAIYRGTYTGWYCTGCEAFFTAAQLIDGKCPDQGHPVEEVEEASWFFRLSAFQERLLEWYDQHPVFVLPESRRNEVRSFVASGLRDLSISRSRDKVSWGIDFPGDPEQVVYVWFDALTNYLSALGFGDPASPSLRDRFWNGTPESTVLHLVGKDILRFHAVYWPAFLMAAELPLPSTIFGHGWWLRDEAKMSKTAGNVARPGPLLETFGVDALRWFLLREIPLGLDGSYSDEGVLDRTNSDLANNIGNLFSRVVALVGQKCGGVVPGDPPFHDPELEEPATAARSAYLASMSAHEPSGALRALTEWADALNKFLVRHQPWRTEGRETECRQVLRTSVDHLAHLALRLYPAMPDAATKLWQALGLPGEPGTAGDPYTDRLAVDHWPVAGGTVASSLTVFPRLDRKVVLAGAKAPLPSTPPPEKKPVSAPPAPPPELIDIETFGKIQLRTAKVLECVRHPNAEKLLVLQIDLGGEKRQLVAGIAKAYAPEQLVGKTIVVVANLKPAMLRGMESRGMLLAATGEDGVPHVLIPDGDMPPGCKVS